MNPQDPSFGKPDDRQDFHPDQTFSLRESAPTPGASVAPTAPTSSSPEPVAQATQASTPTTMSPAPQPSVTAAQSTQPPEQHLFHADEPQAPQVPTAPMQQDYIEPTPINTQMQHNGQTVSWTASEFVAHEKSMEWYLLLGIATVVGAILMYVITRDFISTFMVVFGAAVFGVAASRQPRQLDYKLDSRGLTIGPKAYLYQNFRSFSVVQEGPLRSITFMPLKRFSPPISVFYDPADEDRIIDTLADHLPMQEHRHDPVDKLMRRIRF